MEALTFSCMLVVFLRALKAKNRQFYRAFHAGDEALCFTQVVTIQI